MATHSEFHLGDGQEDQSSGTRSNRRKLDSFVENEYMLHQESLQKSSKTSVGSQVLKKDQVFMTTANTKGNNKGNEDYPQKEVIKNLHGELITHITVKLMVLAKKHANLCGRTLKNTWIRYFIHMRRTLWLFIKRI